MHGAPSMILSARRSANCWNYGRPGRSKDRKSTRLNSSNSQISYAVFCLKKKKKVNINYSLADHVRRLVHVLLELEVLVGVELGGLFVQTHNMPNKLYYRTTSVPSWLHAD